MKIDCDAFLERCFFDNALSVRKRVKRFAITLPFSQCFPVYTKTVENEDTQCKNTKTIMCMRFGVMSLALLQGSVFALHANTIRDSIFKCLNSGQRFPMYEFSRIAINVFDCVDGRRKHSKKCAFSKENILVRRLVGSERLLKFVSSAINEMWIKCLTFDLRHQAKAAPSLPLRIAFILIVLQID